jgi:hypothetical protein
VPAPTGRPQVAAVRYRVELDADRALLERAASAYADLSAAPVERRSPKGSKTVDVRRSVAAVEPADGAIEFDIAVSNDGFARPEEVVRALANACGAPLAPRAVIRIQILVAATPAGAAIPVESTA